MPRNFSTYEICPVLIVTCDIGNFSDLSCSILISVVYTKQWQITQIKLFAILTYIDIHHISAVIIPLYLLL